MKQLVPVHTLEVRHLLELLQRDGIKLARLDPDALAFIDALRRGEQLPPDEMQLHLDRWLVNDTSRARGLEVGTLATITELGAFGHAILSSRNFRAAVKMIVTYRSVLRSMHEVAFEFEHGEFRCSMINLVATGETGRFFTESWLAAHHKLVKMVLGDDVHFSSVSLAYSRPDSAGEYENLFRCPVSFDQERSGYVLPESLVDAPFSFSNEDVRLFCEKQCQLMMDNLHSGSKTVDRARELMLKNPGWFPSCDELASAMNVSSRTLRRKLSAEKSSYREILESVRRELAQNYLRSTDMTVESIAYRLGYEEPNSFYKAFKRWYGSSPKAFAQQST